jgi:hypothetical protein
MIGRASSSTGGRFEGANARPVPDSGAGFYDTYGSDLRIGL